MRSEYVGAISSLEGVATAIESTWTAGVIGQDSNNWSFPPIKRDDMADYARIVAAKIENLPDDLENDYLMTLLKELPQRIGWFQGTSLPNMPSNASAVAANFYMLMRTVELNLPDPEVFSWEKVKNSDLVPREVSQRVRALEAVLKRAVPKVDQVEAQIDTIKSAYDAARSLPTDLASLDDARSEVVKAAAEVAGLLSSAQKDASAASGSAALIQSELEAVKKTVSNIDSAYSAATTLGLAAAFSARADELRMSVRWWVGWLITTLLAGGVLGYLRLRDFQNLVGKGVDDHWMWINAGMSLLTVAAPIWFAWLATRQISQRFRLAEDYAFKASVAKAYEGYRREAARLDPALEARLFASALDRLEEAPLRFLSHEEHGSPYESLFASAGFQKALEKFPGLRDSAQSALDHAKAVVAVATSPPKTASASVSTPEE